MNAATPYKVVCFGEVLWDILPNAELPGGAPMNVAYHLKKLGIEPAMITCVGNDEHGRRLKDILDRNHITTNFFQTDTAHATGLVYANTNNNTEVNYDIVFPSAWDFITYREDAEAIVSNADYLIFGSLACRNNVSRNTLFELIESAKIKVLDINLRPPHFEISVLEYLLKQADILKLNESELELLSEMYTPYKQLEDRIQVIQEKFLLDSVIVTMGENGAAVRDQDRFYRHPGYKVNVADTIGSGDSFLAGYLSEIMNGSSPEKALEFASGLGAFIATRNGACPEYSIADINSVMQPIPTDTPLNSTIS